MRRLLLTGAGLVAVLYLMPVVWLLNGSGAADIPAFVPVVDNKRDADSSAGDDIVPAGENIPGDCSVVTVSIDGEPVELPLETYVEGVTAAEIANDFPLEAIRAQAVAARTYAVYKLSRGRPGAHPDADLCDDFSHCAAYRDISSETASGADYSRIREAVRDTAGEILTYEDAPVAAVFHCASGPRTESARDVWGEDVPYLQSVVSPGGSACDRYEGTFTFTAEEFRDAVSETFPQADLSGAPDDWFKNSVRSEAGGVETVELGGVTVEGGAVRDLFGLYSTSFTITTTEDSLTFHTVGYGHGVGMSQYGARYMAEQGQDYRQILSHYYPGVTLSHV